MIPSDVLSINKQRNVYIGHALLLEVNVLHSALFAFYLHYSVQPSITQHSSMTNLELLKLLRINLQSVLKHQHF